VALIVAGRIKATLPAGEVTVFDIFNIVPFNIDQEDALISVYMTGKDLKNLMELDASAHSFVQWAQLFMSGTEYSIYTNHRIFNHSLLLSH
jgi:2',3'-cyclic-nucleotide 2'-phosphodiesterase (5'-nucleotidase family)